MDRMKRQKIAHESTASYAVSQPLFDALRAGIISNTEQKGRLELARDIVQKVHVKLDPADSKQRKRYIKNVAESWRSACSAFNQLFAELAALSEKDQSTGKEALSGHDDFVAMAKHSKDAHLEVSEFLVEVDMRDSKVEDDEDIDADEDEVDSDVSDDDIVPEKFTAKSFNSPLPGATINGNGKRAAPEGSSPSATISGASKPKPLPSRTIAEPVPRLWKDGIRRSGKSNQDMSMATSSKVSGKPQQKEVSGNVKYKTGLMRSIEEVLANKPNVEFVDVNMEVERRLQEKKEKREKAKQNKKRKRASIDTSELMSVDETVDRPMKKKPKADVSAKGKEAVAAEVKRKGGEGRVPPERSKKRTKFSKT